MDSIFEVDSLAEAVKKIGESLLRGYRPGAPGSIAATLLRDAATSAAGGPRGQWTRQKLQEITLDRSAQKASSEAVHKSLDVLHKKLEALSRDGRLFRINGSLEKVDITGPRAKDRGDDDPSCWLRVDSKPVAELATNSLQHPDLNSDVRVADRLETSPAVDALAEMPGVTSSPHSPSWRSDDASPQTLRSRRKPLPDPVRDQVAVKIARAQRVWQAKKEGHARTTDSTNLESVDALLEQLACPLCGSTASMPYAVRAHIYHDDSTIEKYRTRNYLELRCPECDLHLVGADELEEVGLESWKLTYSEPLDDLPPDPRERWDYEW